MVRSAAFVAAATALAACGGEKTDGREASEKPKSNPVRISEECQTNPLAKGCTPDSDNKPGTNPIAATALAAVAPKLDAAPAEPPPVEVTARQLYADYKANEIAADNKYRRKLLRVSGQITRIAKDVLDKPIVSLATKNEFDPVVASFDNEEGLASLNRGQRIAVLCGDVSMTMGSPLLKPCVLDVTTPKDPALFIPGTDINVTIDLQGKEDPPPDAEQKPWVEAGIAVRNYCSTQQIEGDVLGDLWHTARMSVQRKPNSYVVNVTFDDRRQAVHKGRAPQFEVDAKLTKIRPLNAHARALCKL